MKKKIVLPIIAATIAATVIGTGSLVHAESGGWGRMHGERSEECREFLGNDDYEGWKNFVTAETTEFSTPENFEKLKQVHDLTAAGKMEEAESLREELGMPRGGHGGGQRGQKMNDIRDAIVAQDYEAWKTAMENKESFRGNEIKVDISAETFAKLVEAQQARESGDNAKAREIHEELGFPGGPNQGNGNGLGNGHGKNAK
jgi:hypothetical protein